MEIVRYKLIFPFHFHRLFNEASILAFRQFDKKLFYAVMYGNELALLHYSDFQAMYLSGGEI